MTSFLESSVDMVRVMYESSEGEPPVLSARAMADLDLVLSLVGPSRLHHVHCMASNASHEPGTIDGNLLALQIASSGIVPTGFLRRNGFITLMALTDALNRYVVLLPRRPPLKKPAQDLERLLKLMLPDMRNDPAWLIGRDHVYLMKDAHYALETKRSEKRVTAARSLAKAIFMVRLRNRFKQLVAGRSKAARLVPSPSLAPRVALTGESKRAVVNSSMLLSKQAVLLLRAVQKEPMARAEITLALNDLKQAETDFFELLEPLHVTDTGYGEATDLVQSALAEFIKACRASMRASDDRTDAVQLCKALHQELVNAVRDWRAQFAKLEAGSGGAPQPLNGSGNMPSPSNMHSPSKPRVAGSAPSKRAGPSVVNESRSSGELSKSPSKAMPRRAPPNLEDATPTSSAPGKQLPAPPKLQPKGGLTRATTGAPADSSKPGGAVNARPLSTMLPALPQRPGSQSAGSNQFSGPSSPRSTGGPASPRAAQGAATSVQQGNVVFHDSPKAKRRAQHKEIISKVTQKYGSEAMKSTMDKLDAQLALKDLKKDSCVVQFALPDGLIVRTKVPTKMLCSEAKVVHSCCCLPISC